MKIKNKGLAVLAGVGIAGLVGAAASSLNLTSSSLGSDATVVAACDTTGGINVDYETTFSALAQEFVVDEVVLTDVDAACNGLDLQIVLSDGTVTLGTFTGSAVSATTTAALGTPVSAEDLTNVAVVISG